MPKVDKKSIVAWIVMWSAVALPALAQGLQNPLSVDSIPALLTKIGEGVGELVASIAIIMIILSGIFYLTSAGSPERINRAKSTLTYAIIGLVIGIAATAIVAIVGDVIGIK